MRLRVAIACALFGWGTSVVDPAYAEDVELSTETVGSWEVRQLEDQIDGSTRWIAASDLPDHEGALVIKCDGGKYKEVYAGILFARYLGGDEKRELTWRVDKNEPKTEQWTYDKRWAHSFDTPVVWRLVNQMKDGKTFRARGITYEYQSVDVVIDIAGARAAIKKVYQGCGDTQWKD